MNSTEQQSWQSVHDEVLRRIHTRVWKPGDLIPKEVELAEQLGCARATVNRALRELASEGFLDRRRKAGTRVAAHPVRRAKLDIPVIRLEIEGRGHLADGKPFMFEDRWVSIKATPTILDADLEKISANEWLVLHAPYTRGDIYFSAVNASAAEAKVLRTDPGTSLFLMERTTWENNTGITSARLLFAPGYRKHSAI